MAQLFVVMGYEADEFLTKHLRYKPGRQRLHLRRRKSQTVTLKYRWKSRGALTTILPLRVTTFKPGIQAVKILILKRNLVFTRREITQVQAAGENGHL